MTWTLRLLESIASEFARMRGFASERTERLFRAKWYLVRRSQRKAK